MFQLPMNTVTSSVASACVRCERASIRASAPDRYLAAVAAPSDRLGELLAILSALEGVLLGLLLPLLVNGLVSLPVDG